MQIIRNEIRKHLPHAGEARRLFHGRGHCFAGLDDLVIDFFPPTVVVILHKKRSQGWLEELVRILNNLLPTCPEAILLQERFLPDSSSRLLQGTLPTEVNAVEAGLVYRLRLGEAQNIGFFPDMAAGRKLIRKRSANKKVLNLFAYSCGFSIAALAGGADQVVNLDMNRGALELGKLNHQINGIDLRRASFLPLEFFRSLGKLRKLAPFDLIICDPPSSQGKSFNARQHWPKLIRSLADLIAPRGEILACLNSPRHGPDYLDGLFAEYLPTTNRIGLFTPGKDFPEAKEGCGVTMHLYQFPREGGHAAASN